MHRVPLRVCCLWYTQNYVSCNCGTEMHLQFTQPVTSGESLITSSAAVLLARGYYTRVHRFPVNVGASLKFRTQDPQTVGATVQYSVARANWLAVFVRLWCLSWELPGVLRHISHTLHAASWIPSRYVVSLLLFSASHPRQPTVPSELVFLVISCCQPFIITRHSSWLSKMLNFAENSCSDHCSTEVPFGQHKCCYKELRGQQCVQTACVVCDVADRWQRCAVAAFSRGRVVLKAVMDCGGCL